LDQFPDISEEAKDKLYPLWGDYEDLFYMEWQDVMDRFENLAVSHMFDKGCDSTDYHYKKSEMFS
jgi:hypothetical protein